MSLVKRDLSVGHSEFEGLRRKEREGLPPSSSPERGPLLTKTQAPGPGASMPAQLEGAP